ncbi:MAG: hypothetical protein RBR81_02200, partial [Bacteroidales bacterium]|nr:hypothetical protein [Bacteroidales bacterium]
MKYIKIPKPGLSVSISSPPHPITPSPPLSPPLFPVFSFHLFTSSSLIPPQFVHLNCIEKKIVYF